MLESSYQLVSEQFNPEMEDNTVCALMEEAISNLQMSQVKLKETYECHGKLLIKILQHLENLRSVESSIEKTSQVDHAIIEPRVWRCSINTNGNVRAQNPESTAASATPELPLPTPIGGAHIQFPFPDDVVKVSIDSFPIKLSKGFTVLQACKVVGVDIPRSCCHSLLFVVENCQVCLVEVEKAPKPVISCAMPALLEMTIKTYTLVAKKAREDMMAFQLVNHMLGCPIFDPGGECDHQDQLMALGSEIKRSFAGKASNHVEECGKCVISLVALLTCHFEGFHGHSLYKGHQVFLYKRAHIFASDLWSAFKGQGHGELYDMGSITIFADYIVLAVLRELGLLQNSLALAGTIDANDEINSGREEEVEKMKGLIKSKFRKQESSVEFLVRMGEYTKKKRRSGPHCAMEEVKTTSA